VWTAVLGTILGIAVMTAGTVDAQDAPPPTPSEKFVRDHDFRPPPVIDGEVEAGEWPDDAAATIRRDPGEQCLEPRRARGAAPSTRTPSRRSAWTRTPSTCWCG
jgi:hypothetical protein